MPTNDEQVMRSMVRDDAYHVERVLAEGPSGRTELVTLDGEGLLVRKRIPAALANATAWATVMGLEEPLLPQVEEMYRMPDELVVVCDYVPGDSLRERMAAQSRFDGGQAVSVLHDLCHAAGVLHAHGIVHRDITPGNVILAVDGAHLIDLGIARRDAKTAKRDTHVLGTWGFAAPEQFGFAQTDARSDVYALGRMLGYLLTGVAPSDDAFEKALADEQLVEPALAAVVRHATAFEPSARYQSTSELSAALDEALDEGKQGTVEAKEVALNASGNTGRKPHASAVSGTDANAAMGDGPSVQTAPATPNGPRPVREAPLLIRALADLYWAACVAWILMVVGTGIEEAQKGFQNWKLEQYVLGAITITGALAVACEMYGALTRRWHYADAKMPLSLFLRRAGQVVLYMLMAFGLEVLLAVILSK